MRDVSGEDTKGNIIKNACRKQNVKKYFRKQSVKNIIERTMSKIRHPVLSKKKLMT